MLESAECGPCNYATPGSSCGQASRSNSNSSSCVCDHPEFCDSEWIELHEGEVKTNVILENAVGANLRFFFDKPCRGIRIRTMEVSGRFSGFVDSKILDLNPGGLDVMQIVVAQTSDTFICPQQGIYNYSTWSLQLWAVSAGKANLSVVYTTFEIGQTPLPQVKDISPYSVGFRMYEIPEDVMVGPLSLPLLKPIFFRVSVKECRQLFVQVESYESQVAAGSQLLMLSSLPYQTTTGTTVLLRTGPTLFTVCPKIDNQTEFLYLTLVSFMTDTDVMFLISSNPHDLEFFRVSQIPITPNDPFPIIRFLEGIASVYCDEAQKDKTFECWYGCTVIPACCSNLWPIFPSADPFPFYPVPTGLKSMDAASFSPILDWKNLTQSDTSKQYVTLGMLLQVIAETSVLTPLKQWESTLETSCKIVFPSFSQITTANNEILRGSVSLEGKQSEKYCDAEKFHVVSDNIERYSSQLKTASDYLITIRFQVDEETFSLSWQNCNAYIQGYLEPVSQVVKIEDTTFCSAEMFLDDYFTNHDPCCNEELAWTQCCIPRTIEVDQITSQIMTNLSSHVPLNCDPDCVDSILEDYVFFDNFLKSEAGCQSAIQSDVMIEREKALDIYRTCKHQNFGKDGQGVDCVNDDQCAVGTCDILHRRCVFTDDEYKQAVTNFFQCYQTQTT